MPKQTPKPPKPRRKTRVWKEASGDWRYEVTHPDGHQAAGAYLPNEKAAKDAAKQAKFT